MSARRPARAQHAAATATVTPRILNLARRSSSAAGGRPSRGVARPQQPRPAPQAVNLGALFEMERRVRGLESAPASPPCSSRGPAARPREREDAAEQEEKWRFQAEILRAECNFLRMEREVALRKLDCHRGQMEAALKTAVETLASGRKKIDGSGEVGVAAALEEGIEDLKEMMQELRVEKESGRRAMSGTRELRRSHGRNFDRQASSLRRRLEKMPSADAEPTIKDIREIARPVSPPLPPPADHSDGDDHAPSANLSDVEMLRVKMEGMSNGMRERMAEYSRRLEAVASGGDNAGCQSRKCGSRHSRKASACSQRSWSGSSNASNGSNVAAFRQNASHGGTSVASEKNHPHKIVAEDCKLVRSGSCCDCKEIVGKIMKQVRAESEQWTEMQDMLEQVRLEMQELQSSRDTWQRRAIASDISLGSLNSEMLEWKQRAQASEQHAEELQKKVSELQGKLHTFKSHFPAPNLPSRAWSEACRMENPRAAKAQHHHHRPPQQQQQQQPDCGKEKEKHVLICRVRHSPSVIPRRSPLQDIGNIALPRRLR
ncbi:uncharacterized protein LOC123449297 [Hordeum vulgare subsp. vulgare]|uniref:Uncharacterized protein n=1 Tax=Hordeum vulgare subsp. vulgare TaxID=112509 RepID=A0A287PGC8_HORVV|nr:uncharacterized protein LOC123449297 [Hordeum vulgare subsp. vulgare]